MLANRMTASHTSSMERGARKVKVTVSLSSDLLRRLDSRRKKGKQSRSAAIEAAIAAEDRAERKRQLEEEIRAYYAEGDPEGDAISKWMGQAMKKIDFDDDGGSKRRKR